MAQSGMRMNLVCGRLPALQKVQFISGPPPLFTWVANSNDATAHVNRPTH